LPAIVESAVLENLAHVAGAVGLGLFGVMVAEAQWTGR
jgi:hypothetical protein